MFIPSFYSMGGPVKVWAYIVLGCIGEVGGDTLLKLWSGGGGSSMGWWGLICYTIGSVFWILLLREQSLSKSIILFAVVNTLALVLIGVYGFGDTLTVAAKIGIALGVGSLILTSL